MHYSAGAGGTYSVMPAPVSLWSTLEPQLYYTVYSTCSSHFKIHAAHPSCSKAHTAHIPEQPDWALWALDLLKMRMGGKEGGLGSMGSLAQFSLWTGLVGTDAFDAPGLYCVTRTPNKLRRNILLFIPKKYFSLLLLPLEQGRNLIIASCNNLLYPPCLSSSASLCPPSLRKA